MARYSGATGGWGDGVSEKPQLIDAVLETLSIRKGTLGVMLVRRDGVCTTSRGPRSVAPETVAAMTAVAFGAAEVILNEFGREPLQRFQAETSKFRLIALAATDELLLVAVVDPRVSWDEVSGAARAATADIARIVSG